MPCGSDMHSDRDLFWSMHRDDATSFTAIVLHRWRRAVSNRVYMYSDHDLRRTLPHHGTQLWATNPDMRSGGIAMSCGGHLYSDRGLFWCMHCDDTTSSTNSAPESRANACSSAGHRTGTGSFSPRTSAGVCVSGNPGNLEHFACYY